MDDPAKISDAFMAIDGSKFKAVNSSARNFTHANIKRRLKEIDKSVDQYLKQIISADRLESPLQKTKLIVLKIMPYNQSRFQSVI